MTLSRRALLRAAACGLVAMKQQLQPAAGGSVFAAPRIQAAAGGTASATVGPVSLKPGIAVIQVQTNGSGHVSASLVTANSSGPPFPLFDRNGPFKASAATLIAAQAVYYAEITAPQACQLLFQQPVPEMVQAVQTSSLSGQGKDVSSYFTPPSSVSILSLQTTSSALKAWLYHLDDSGGEVIHGGVNGGDGRFFDLAASGSAMSYPVSLPDAGPYLLAVDGVAPSDTWTFSLS